MPDIELVRYDLDEDRFPDSVDECDGWLLSPSRCSVYDDHPWIRSGRGPAARTHRPGTPVRRHLLRPPARRAGAGGARRTRRWTVGRSACTTTRSMTTRPWMDPPALDGSAHREPRGPGHGRSRRSRRSFARTPGCPIAGLAIGERAWTLQPHPEFVPELADHLLAQRVELIGAEKVAAARATLARPLDRSTVASWIATFLPRLTLAAPDAPGPGPSRPARFTTGSAFRG